MSPTLLCGKETRAKSMLASALVLLGGRKSADDPEAYFTVARPENATEPEDKI